MRVPTDQDALEALVKATRQSLREHLKGEAHLAPMARLSVSCFPDFLVALSAELRSGTFPPFVESAVMTLIANMLLTLAHTAAEDGDNARRKECCDAYLRTFITAYCDKAAKLCGEGTTAEQDAHTVAAPVGEQ